MRRGWRKARGRCAAAMLALGVALVAGEAAAGEVYDRLSARARAQLERGEQVVRTQDVEDSAWPAVTAYQLLRATPEQAIAVFTDFADQASYLRDCCGVVQSVVRDTAVGGDPRVVRVFYELKVPIISNERYELLETLGHEDDTYRVTWRKTGDGGHAEDISGEAYFEPLGNGSLFVYRNVIKMNMLGAGLLAGQSVDRTKATVMAIGRHVDRLASSRSRKLDQEIARIRRIFP